MGAVASAIFYQHAQVESAAVLSTALITVALAVAWPDGEWLQYIVKQHACQGCRVCWLCLRQPNMMVGREPLHTVLQCCSCQHMHGNLARAVYQVAPTIGQQLSPPPPHTAACTN
ncbi:hypothetical protein COO60DRAFT_357656 [Scenedesmus sp. NREL 46B-D3]|nr:hypothetical protein COO60DRAFT_357656 [Scenedesmus sp. NREL 46B-D3]